MASVKANRDRQGKVTYTVYFRVGAKPRERTFKLRKDADDFRVKYEHHSREHIFTDPKAGRAVFTENAGIWIDRNAKLTPATRASYHSVLKTQIAPWAGARSIAAIASDREGFSDFINSLDLSTGRTGQVVAVVTGSLKEAARQRKIPMHNLAGLGPGRSDTVAGRTEIPDVTFAQLEQITTALGRDGLAVMIMRGCGLRIDEALALRREDFGADGWLTVERQRLRDGSEATLKRRKDNRGRRVPVPSWLAVLIEDRPAGELFPGLRYGAFYNRFKRACKAAGCPDLKTHELRHLFASTLIGLPYAVPISDVADWLGHKDFNVTYASYSHLVPASETRARLALNSIPEVVAS